MFPLRSRYVKPQGVVYVASTDHLYSLNKLHPLIAEKGGAVQMWGWDKLFRTRFPPRAAYILTDFDRLATAEIEAAGRVYNRLKEAGLPVLNNPRAFRPRDALIRTLYETGINSYSCSHPGFGEGPNRFPCFLRTIAGHRGVESEVLHTAAEAQAALEAALTRGHPISDLIFVDYVEAADDKGVFTKRAAFLLGGEIQRANMVREMFWTVKSGNIAIATPEDHIAERAEMTNYPRAAMMKEVAAATGMDFGRIDYGLVQGRVEVFEMNTNPSMNITLAHPNPDRRGTIDILRHKITDFLVDLGRSVQRGEAPSLRGSFKAKGRILRRPRRR